MHTLLIFLGAGLGGVFRYWVSNGIYFLFGRQFPYGTLFVNATGSFLIGFIFILLLARFDGVGSQLRSLLLIGFLGGYTSFASFSIETLTLFENGYWLNGCLNIIVSIVLCISLAWLGVMGGKQLS